MQTSEERKLGDTDFEYRDDYFSQVESDNATKVESHRTSNSPSTLSPKNQRKFLVQRFETSPRTNLTSITHGSLRLLIYINARIYV